MFPDRITLVEKMVTDNPRDNRFYICEQGQSSMLKNVNTYQEHKINLGSNSINSMNEYLNDDPIDLVWIDVQGFLSETNVLRSFGNKINNVRSIYCEVNIKSNRYDMTTYSNSTLKTVTELLSNFTVSDYMHLNENEVHVIFESKNLTI